MCLVWRRKALEFAKTQGYASKRAVIVYTILYVLQARYVGICVYGWDMGFELVGNVLGGTEFLRFRFGIWVVVMVCMESIRMVRVEVSIQQL